MEGVNAGGKKNLSLIALPKERRQRIYKQEGGCREGKGRGSAAGKRLFSNKDRISSRKPTNKNRTDRQKKIETQKKNLDHIWDYEWAKKIVAARDGQGGSLTVKDEAHGKTGGGGDEKDF